MGGAKEWAAVMALLVLLIWNGALIVGTAYIVFGLGYSGWWWLLTLILMSGSASASTK